MLPKIHRLPGYRIPEVVKTGRRFHSAIATLVIQNQPDKDSLSRFTVSVPIRLSKKAVQRNRTKRLIRASIHTSITRIKPGFDGMFMGKKLLSTEKLSDVLPHIEALLKKAELLEKK